MANKRKSPDTLEGVRQLADKPALWALDRQVGHRTHLRHGWQEPRICACRRSEHQGLAR